MKKARLEKSYWGYIFIIPFFVTYLIFATYPLALTFYQSLTDRQTFEFRGIREIPASLAEDGSGRIIVAGEALELLTDEQGDYVMLPMDVPSREPRRAEIILGDERQVTAVAFMDGEEFVGFNNFYRSRFIEFESFTQIPVTLVEGFMGVPDSLRLGPGRNLRIRPADETFDSEYVLLTPLFGFEHVLRDEQIMTITRNDDGTIYISSTNVVMFQDDVHQIFIDYADNREYIILDDGSERDIVRTGDGEIRVGSLQVNGVFGITNYRNAFFNTPLLWIMGFVPQIALALLLAAWFTDTKLRAKGQSFFKTVFYMPNMMTAATISALFLSFVGAGGIIHQLALAIGYIETAADPITSEWFTRALIAFINTWMWFGNTMIIMIAGINSISLSLFEAARIDGANSRKIFWHITVPMIKPILTFTFIQSLVGGLQMFDIPALLAGATYTNLHEGAMTTIMTSIQQVAFEGNYAMGLASAMSVVLFLITAVFGSVIFVLMRDRSDEKWLKQQAKQQKHANGGKK